MIQDLILKNHECHKNTQITFSPGLNVFIGPSDHGKSSVFRAMYWLINNRPLGDQMMPLFWEGITEVSANFLPGGLIARWKGPGLNHYQINSDDKINAGSGAPPQSIADIIQMDDVNFQTQVDRAYLMFDTPGERGRILNRIAGLDDIDRTMANAKKDETQLRRMLETSQAQLKEFQEQGEQYSNIEEQESDLLACENLEKRLLTSVAKSTRIESASRKIRAVNCALKSISHLDSAEEAVNGLNIVSKALTEARSTEGMLDKLLGGLRRNNRTLASMTNYEGAGEGIAEMGSVIVAIAKKKQNIEKLQTIIRNLSIVEKSIVEKEEGTKELERTLPLIKVCPSCKRSL